MDRQLSLASDAINIYACTYTKNYKYRTRSAMTKLGILSYTSKTANENTQSLHSQLDLCVCVWGHVAGTLEIRRATALQSAR